MLFIQNYLCVFININPVFIWCYSRRRRWPEVRNFRIFKWLITFSLLGAVGRMLFELSANYLLLSLLSSHHKVYCCSQRIGFFRSLTHAQTIAVHSPLLPFLLTKSNHVLPTIHWRFFYLTSLHTWL